MPTTTIEAKVRGETSEENAILIISFKGTDDKVRKVEIDISDLITLAASNSNIPDTFRIGLKEWDVCVEGESKKAVFLSSEPYDPPP